MVESTEESAGKPGALHTLREVHQASPNPNGPVTQRTSLELPPLDLILALA
jgi:hypothetical protein